MSKVFGAGAAVVCAVTIGATAVLAAGLDDETASRYCRERGDLGLSHGACVAYLKNGNTTPHDAAVCKLAWVRSFTGAKNEGECVTALAAMKR